MQVKGRPKMAIADSIVSFSYDLFQQPATKMSDSMPSLRDDLLKSNIRLAPESFLSLTLFATLISSMVASVVAILGYLFGQLILTLVMVAPPLVFLIFLNSPKFSRSSRSHALESELPFIIGYMTVLAGGGVSPLSTLRRISKMSILPASTKESKRILNDIDIFGMDPLTALERAAAYNPNRVFSEFLYGYTTILKTGGDLVNYLNIKLKETFEREARN